MMLFKVINKGIAFQIQTLIYRSDISQLLKLKGF